MSGPYFWMRIPVTFSSLSLFRVSLSHTLSHSRSLSHSVSVWVFSLLLPVFLSLCFSSFSLSFSLCVSMSLSFSPAYFLSSNVSILSHSMRVFNNAPFWGVVNPYRRLEEYLPSAESSINIIFYYRIFNNEVACGSYIVRLVIKVLWWSKNSF